MKRRCDAQLLVLTGTGRSTNRLLCNDYVSFFMFMECSYPNAIGAVCCVHSVFTVCSCRLLPCRHPRCSAVRLGDPVAGLCRRDCKIFVESDHTTRHDTILPHGRLQSAAQLLQVRRRQRLGRPSGGGGHLACSNCPTEHQEAAGCDPASGDADDNSSPVRA